MCTVSMIGDFYRDKWINPAPMPYPATPQKTPFPFPSLTFPPPVTREELDKLKSEVEDMKELLKRAKLYDEENGEPACEIEEKMQILRKVAELVGVSLDDVLGSPKT